MTLKIGLIGCGGITRAHVEGWKTVTDQAEIVAVADVSQAAMETRAAQIGRPVQMFTDFAQLLANANVDAVDLALPHHLHREAIIAAAQAGKHILTEKPLCLNLQEASEIAAAVAQSGVTMMAAHNQIFFPAVQQAKQMLMKGDLGRVYMIHSFDCSARRPALAPNKSTWGQAPIAPTTWRQDPAKMGGGEYIDTGYHPTYRLLFLAGQMPSEVSAMMGTYRLAMHEEDTANVMLKFADGMMGNVFTSWAMPAPGGQPLLFSIQGEAGQLWGEIGRLSYQPVGFQQPAVVEYPDWDYGRSFGAEIAHFVNAIQQGYEPLHSVKEATDTLRIIMAAYEATDTNRVMPL
jgi:predicted dehydrogenase